MPNDTSARLNLPYLAAGQLQKHVTLNQALTRLDALAQTAAISRFTTAQPTTPTDGDLYILPPASTGPDWSTRSTGDLMRAETGGWTRVTPVEGMIVVVLTPPEIVVRRGSAWTPLPVDPATVAQNLTRLGLNTAADAANPFSAKLNKALWTALEAAYGGDGDLRMTLNKEGAADVLSILFQSGYGGRAEFGLIGDDDVRLKVSSDGGTWHDALTVDADTGAVRFEKGALRSETTILTGDASYGIPVWARWLDVMAVGGGGGGGSGAAGTSAVARFGGGGGGAGGISMARWSVAALASPLAVGVGSGGGGGNAVGTGSGTDGVSGQVTTLSSAGVILLTGSGGQGGRGGTTSGGTGGQGGAGVPTSNPGGSASITAAGATGADLIRPDGSGGGGGGGGLDASGVAWAGGPGGAGSPYARMVAGGSGGTGAAGGPGATAPDLALGASGGGGGGGSNASGSGHAGGTGTTGSGGGGGGAGTTGSGAGGAGGSGYVRITAIG